MGSSHVSSGRVSLGLADLTGLDLVDWARPASRGLNPVDPFLVLLWIFCSALEVGGVLQAGEVRGRWYLYSQDRLSILGCSTQRLFSTTSNFKRLRLRPRSFLENMNQGVKKERAEGIYVPRSIYNHSSPGFRESGMLVLPHSLCVVRILYWHFTFRSKPED